MKEHIQPLNQILHLSRELTTNIKNELGNHFAWKKLVALCCIRIRQPKSTR
jgi:hypothetical protein